LASTFLDLLQVKVALQLGLVVPAQARAALQAADVDADGVSTYLAQQAGVAVDLVSRMREGAQQCMTLKSEGIYCRNIVNRSILSQEQLQPLLRQPRAPGMRVGELLVQQGLVTEEQDAELSQATDQQLEQDNNSVASKYREASYSGIEAPSRTVADVAARIQQAIAAPAVATAVPAEVGARSAMPAQPAPLPTAPSVPVAPAKPALPPELADTGLDEKYQIQRKLGEGGMGAVYLAFEVDDAACERPMALKVVRGLEKSKDAAGRFKREILATSFCAHENIIEIYDGAETQDGSYYMAMEFIDGAQLDEILKKEKRLGVARVVDLLDEALLGLDAAHRANIVHRDIKPQNFRIWWDEEKRERLKIMDFGIARVLDAEDSGAGDQFFRTMGGKITGSPAYISPEGITEPDTLDQRADLYSLGISLYRLITGRLPFTAREPTEFLTMHLYEKPPSLREAVPEVPEALEQLYLKMLEKLPKNRIATAHEALEWLRTKVRPALGMPQARAVLDGGSEIGPIPTDDGASAPLPAPPPMPDFNMGASLESPAMTGPDGAFAGSADSAEETSAGRPSSLVPDSGEPGAQPAVAEQAAPLHDSDIGEATMPGAAFPIPDAVSPNPSPDVVTQQAENDGGAFFAQTADEDGATGPPPARSKTPLIVVGVVVVLAIGGVIAAFATGAL
jgi:eukaryotic-like serine/threonine-protein kinase